MADIQQLFEHAREELHAASTPAELDAARIRHLGRSAPLIDVLRNVRDLPADQRATVGKEGNIARQKLEQLCEQRSTELETAELDRRLREERIDVTLPPRQMAQGTLHLLTQTRRVIEDAMLGMGYSIADGPEVETAFFNFTALNTPDGHPARSPSDTYYLDGDVLLRTQTSPVQVRVMQNQPPPIYVISPGRVYRRDRIDATHSNMFHQVEGLAVDRGLTLADLKGTIEALCRAIFGDDAQIRLRNHFFPFTEPSVEADVSCFMCGGTGAPAAGDDDYDKCRLCKGIGWIEIMGAGMVDPNVFSQIDGYDPDEVSGFAFGIGIDRVAMLRHGIPDMRLLFENDLRFLNQFPGR